MRSGVDLGGTKIEAVTLNDCGIELAKQWVATKTNPAPDKPLALKSRGVVEFTATEGLVTRNKSTSPVFR